MASKIGHGHLVWKYNQAARATAISNDQIDLYKDRIRTLYLEQNLSRKQVIRRLEEIYGFAISPDQFSKATSRWRFQKLPRKRRQSTVPSTATADSTSPQNPLFQTSNETPASEKSQPRSETGKRPRSMGNDDELSLDTGNTGPSTSSRPAKRCKPTSNVHDTLEQILEILENSPAFEQDECGSEAYASPKPESKQVDALRPLSLASLDPPHDSSDLESPLPLLNSTADVEKLCAEYLESCYLFKRAFRRYAKLSIPFQSKTSSSKERRSRMLDLARTAKSRSTREVVRVMLESELKASYDPLDTGPGNAGSWPLKDEISPHESFLFHRHLAKIYSYHYNKASEVQEHLQKALNFTDNSILAGSPQVHALDLWTFQHLSDTQGKHTISDSMLAALGGNLPIIITPCLLWCKKRLQNLGGSAADLENLCDIRNTTTDPTSISRWRLKWGHTVLWAHTNYLFAYLWQDLQIHPPAIDDVLIWLNEEFLPGISATQFLMIVCRMIVDEARFFAPRGSSDGRAISDEEPGDLVNHTLYNIPSCLMAIDQIVASHQDSPRATCDRFVNQFRRHHEWATSTTCKKKMVKQVQAQMLQHLRSTVKLMTHPRTDTPSPPTPKMAPEGWPDGPDVDVVSLTDSSSDPTVHFESSLEEMMKRTTISMSEGIPSILTEAPSERTSSIASGSAASFRAHQAFFNALSGDPPFTKSMVSRESYSSETSHSSSLQRFRAAGRPLSGVPSSFSGYRNSANSRIEAPIEASGELLFPPLMGVVHEDDEGIVEPLRPKTGGGEVRGIMRTAKSSHSRMSSVGRLERLWRGKY